MIEFDVETTGLQWYAADLFLVTFKQGETIAVLRHPEDQLVIQEWLSRDDDFRAWNTKFDLHFLKSAGYELPPEDRWHDGMVVAHIVNEQRSLALKSVAESMLGADERDPEKAVKDWLTGERAVRRKRAKSEGIEYKAPNYSDVPYVLMEPYAIQDVVLTQRVCEAMHLTPDLGGVYEKERQVLAALFAAERRGLPIDIDATVAFRDELLGSLEGLEQECIDLAGIDTFNPGSSAQIREALERRGADLGKAGVTTKGAMSMDVGSLTRIDDPLCHAILKFRSEFKMLGTYIKPMLQASMDGTFEKAAFIVPGPNGSWRIHANVRQVGAKTGRMSSSDPNIQNWPRDDLRLRYLLRADPQMALLTADLSSIEMVVFAAFLGEGALFDLICDPDKDAHAYVADLVDLRERVRPDGSITTKRQQGKTFNFTMVYGGGTRSLMEFFGVSEGTARWMLDTYHARFPEIGALQRKIRYALEDKGYIKTPWGRRHRLKPRDAWKGVNAVVQGTAADILKDAIIRCHADAMPLISCVHDELLFHVNAAHAEAMMPRVIEYMTDHPAIAATGVPIEAEGAIVQRWSEAKDPDFLPSFLTR